MDEEGAHEEADADKEVERVDERPAPLWTEGEHEEDAVCREEDSIASKLNNVMTNMVDVCLIIQSKHVNSGLVGEISSDLDGTKKRWKI